MPNSLFGNPTLDASGTSYWSRSRDGVLSPATSGDALSMSGPIEIASNGTYKLNGAHVISGDPVANNYFFGTLGNLSATGTDNLSVGPHTLAVVSTGYNNTAMGASALSATIGGNNNTAMGWRAGLLISSGGSNTAIGSLALANATTGTANTAVGVNVLTALTEGSYNVSVGGLHDMTTGTGNTSVGAESGYHTSTSSFNTAVGANALNDNTIGGNNTAVGMGSLYHNIGSGNVALGFYAGYNRSNDSNIFVLDNQNRGSSAGDVLGSLMWGAFNADPSMQTLRINAALTTNGGLQTFGANDSAGAGYRLVRVPNA